MKTETAKTMAEFTGIYQLSQTLKFELKPIGRTEEMLEKSGILEQDFKRAEDYPAAKEYLDKQHKAFLEKVLSGITVLDWEELAELLEKFSKIIRRKKTDASEKQTESEKIKND